MKKHFVFVFLFITITFSFAQDLHVSNNSSIFVDGNGFTSGPNVAPLYVTNDISLATATSTIYLRNEAQLIQGDETERNIGLGNVSVYQEGTVNKWAYNYWCSPVGLPSATVANGVFAPARMQQATTLTTSINFNYPGTGQFDGDNLTNPVTIANAWFYTFTESDSYNDWFSIETGTAAVGLGFTMKGTNATSGGFDPITQGQHIDFRGKANTGTIDVPVNAPLDPFDNNPADGDFKYQWTLTGNPYPSAIDMRDLLWDDDNLGSDLNFNGDNSDDGDELTTGTLYYWDQEPSDNSHFIEDYRGGYNAVTIDNSGVISFTAALYWLYDGAGNQVNCPVPPCPTSGKTPPNRYIPIGQGFMIEGKNDGVFKIKNSHRTFYKEAGAESMFFEANNTTETKNSTNNSRTNELTDEGYSVIPENYKRFRLFVEFNELYTRELLHNFKNTATASFDYGLEAKSPEGVASDASWTLDGVPYVIQAHSFDESLKIPLVINVTETQPLNFRIADIQHIDQSLPIYLHDIDNNLYVNLRDQNYDMILEVGDYSSRFEITFNKEALGLTEEELTGFKILQNNSLEQLTILNPNSLDIQSVNLIDVSGKQIFNQRGLVNNTKHTFLTNNLSEGVYIASVTLKNKHTITQKVIISH